MKPAEREAIELGLRAAEEGYRMAMAHRGIGSNAHVLCSQASDALSAALAAPAEPQGWQPIETAPKDRMLLAVVDGLVRVVRWCKTSHVFIYGWCLIDQGPEDVDLCEPTLWQLYPEPPAEASE